MRRRALLTAAMALPAAALAAPALPAAPLPAAPPPVPPLPVLWATDYQMNTSAGDFVHLCGKQDLVGSTAVGDLLRHGDPLCEFDGETLEPGEGVLLWAHVEVAQGEVSIRPLPGDDATAEEEDAWHEHRIVTDLIVPANLSGVAGLPPDVAARAAAAEIHVSLVNDPEETALCLEDLTEDWGPGESHLVQVIAWVRVPHRYDGATGTLVPVQPPHGAGVV